MHLATPSGRVTQNGSGSTQPTRRRTSCSLVNQWAKSMQRLTTTRCAIISLEGLAWPLDWWRIQYFRQNDLVVYILMYANISTRIIFSTWALLQPTYYTDGVLALLNGSTNNRPNRNRPASQPAAHSLYDCCYTCQLEDRFGPWTAIWVYIIYTYPLQIQATNFYITSLWDNGNTNSIRH